MGFDLSKVRAGTIVKPPKLIIMGEPKIGKTTFCSQAGKPLLVPLSGEDGANEVDVDKTPVVGSLCDLMEILSWLATNEHEYNNIVIDSLSALEPILWTDVCAKHKQASIESFGYGKGYVEAGVSWRELLSALDYLRDEKSMGIMLIGHTKVKSFSDPSGETYDRYELDLHKSAAADVQRWADCILFARWKAITKKIDGKGFAKDERKVVRSDRVLCGQTNGAFPAGGRGVYGHLPVEMELSYTAFQQAVREAQQ